MRLGVAAGCGYLLKHAVSSSHIFDLRSKVVLITGGSRGLGLTLTRQLEREGCRIALCARDGEELRRAKTEVGNVRSVEIFQCDLRAKSAIETLVTEVTARFGPVDVLIHNAGVISIGPLESMTEEDFRESLDVHLWAAIHLANLLVPRMRERRSGRLAFISSIGGEMAVPHLIPYCTGKFALAGFSRGLRTELSKDGIYVTTIFPGLMRTGSPYRAHFKSKHRLEQTWFTLADSVPGLSMNAERAARAILRAIRVGEAERTLGVPARIASTAAALFPRLTYDLLGAANRFLPGYGGIREGRRTGRESRSALSPSVFTSLTDAAARRNNELAADS